MSYANGKITLKEHEKQISFLKKFNSFKCHMYYIKDKRLSRIFYMLLDLIISYNHQL